MLIGLGLGRSRPMFEAVSEVGPQSMELPKEGGSVLC